MASESFSQRAIQAIAENKIKAAMEEGEFENLPGFGRPFEFDDTHYDPHWWIRRKVERERIKNLFSQSPQINPDPQNRVEQTNR